LDREAVSVHVARRDGSNAVIHRYSDEADINIGNSRVIDSNMRQSLKRQNAGVAGQNFGWDGLKE
jgi:hypothetical protein